MKVLVYCRLSQDEKDTERNKFDNQLVKIDEYCKNNNLEIVGIEEEIISGNTLKRKQLQKLLSRRRVENADGIVVYCVDRLSRNVENLKHLIYLAEKDEFIWFFAREGLTTKDKDNYDKILYYGNIAQEENDIISARISSGLDANKVNNKKTGGYDAYGKDSNEDGYYSLNEEEQYVIKKIIELREQDRMSWNEIANFLNDNNITSKRGTRWSATTVMRIYKDRDNRLKIITHDIK